MSGERGSSTHAGERSGRRPDSGYCVDAPSGDDDWSPRRAHDSSRNATTEFVSARTDHDQARASVTRYLGDSSLGRALEDHAFGFDAGACGHLQRLVENPSSPRHLRAQPALIHGFTKKPGRSATNVNKDDWRVELIGEADRSVEGGGARGGFVDACNDRWFVTVPDGIRLSLILVRL
jgi:hypothetical protein